MEILILLFYSPGLSLYFSGNPLPDKLNCGPLSRFIFSGLYVPGAIRKSKYKRTLIYKNNKLNDKSIWRKWKRKRSWPGLSFGFSDIPFPYKLYCGPLFKFIFSGLYVPGAMIEKNIKL